MATRPPEHDRDALFHERLGYALGRWQHVEMELFRIYARVMRCENHEVVSASFHSIASFRARLLMTDGAANVALSGRPSLAQWDRLRKRCEKRYKTRNKLAHFVVIYGVNQPPKKAGPFLQPSIYDVRGGPLAGRKNIDVAQLLMAANSFDQLSEELRRFADSLPRPAAPPGALV